MPELNLLPSEIKRETFVKSEDTSDELFGKRPEERSIQDYIQKGVVNLDKPAGPRAMKLHHG